MSPWKPSKKNPAAIGSDVGDTVGAEQSSESVLDQLPGGKEASEQCLVTACHQTQFYGAHSFFQSEMKQFCCIADLLCLPGKVFKYLASCLLSPYLVRVIKLDNPSLALHAGDGLKGC